MQRPVFYCQAHVSASHLCDRQEWTHIVRYLTTASNLTLPMSRWGQNGHWNFTGKIEAEGAADLHNQTGVRPSDQHRFACTPASTLLLMRFVASLRTEWWGWEGTAAVLPPSWSGSWQGWRLLETQGPPFHRLCNAQLTFLCSLSHNGKTPSNNQIHLTSVGMPWPPCHVSFSKT